MDCHCESELFISSLFLSLAQSFIEGQQFFEKYETLFQTLKCSAELYVKADCTGKAPQSFLDFKLKISFFPLNYTNCV